MSECAQSSRNFRATASYPTLDALTVASFEVTLPLAAPNASSAAQNKVEKSNGGDSVASMCTESGIWQPVRFVCLPLPSIGGDWR